MSCLTVTLLITLVIAISLATEHNEEHHHGHPKYEFKYGVKDEHTHDIKEQAEKRDGHKVEGHYMLVEADGTIRTVHYNADKHTGFHAHVHRAGHAVHPIHHEKKMEIHHEKRMEIHHEKKMEINHEKKMEAHHKEEEKASPKSHEGHKFTATSYANSHLQSH